MKRIAIELLIILLFICSTAFSQVLVPDFSVNIPASNLNGLGRTAIAAGSDGSMAIAWLDYNPYDDQFAQLPRIAVQRFNVAAQRVGQTHFFSGENAWIQDYMIGNPDIAMVPGNTALIAMEHYGDDTFGFSSEVGIGGVDANGNLLDLNNTIGVVYWLINVENEREENPRIAAAPSGSFAVSLNGRTFDTGFSAVAVQLFDAAGNTVGNFFNPHFTDPGPNANHVYSDLALADNLALIVWEDGRQDNNYDISGQFYNSVGAVGSNFKINTGDAAGTLNLRPAVGMTPTGNSVVVWADARTGSPEIFGQLYNSSAQPVGSNFQISQSSGIIWDRPEIAVRTDGSFMVVWTDSLPGVTGVDAFRARGRQFAANGTPLGDVFVIPDVQNTGSGYVNIATNGSTYFISWLDNRLNSTYLNAYAKAIGNISTGIGMPDSDGFPAAFALSQNYPNPFNPQTTIRFALPEAADVSLVVFDLTGKKVQTILQKSLPAGVFEQSFVAENLPSGMYFYQLTANPNSVSGKPFSEIRKMILIK